VGEPLDGLDAVGVREGPELEVGRVGGGGGDDEAAAGPPGVEGGHAEQGGPVQLDDPADRATGANHEAELADTMHMAQVGAELADEGAGEPNLELLLDGGDGNLHGVLGHQEGPDVIRVIVSVHGEHDGLAAEEGGEEMGEPALVIVAATYFVSEEAEGLHEVIALLSDPRLVQVGLARTKQGY